MTPRSALAAVRVGVFLVGLMGIGCYTDGETPILVTITGDSPFTPVVQIIRVTPWLGDRMGEVRTLPGTQRHLVLRAPPGLGGILRLEAAAVDVRGCTIGRGSIQISVVPEFARAIQASVELRDLASAECPPRMVRIDPGTFTMGSATTEMYRGPDELQHQVQITSAYAMSETEVTQRQYQQLMGTNPSLFSDDSARPVESLSWLEAIKYCNQLSMTEGLTPCYQIDAGDNVRWDQGLKCHGYRLPTEAEWEYAARARAETQYAGSANLDEVGWHAGNSGGSTHVVRAKKNNEWGLFDLSGNVWEWVWDWYGAYPTVSLAVDPIGAQSGSQRVVRGGSWVNEPGYARVAYRLKLAPGYRDQVLGFRFVRSDP